MRRRLAIPLIALWAGAPLYWFMPQPPDSTPPAALIAVLELEDDDADFGGISGIEVTGDGSEAIVISDRGHAFRLNIEREGGIPERLVVRDRRALVPPEVAALEYPHVDSEGLALARDGTMYVSFEHAHRIHIYRDWTSAPEWAGYTRSWRALSENGGFEALAIDPQERIFAIPEEIARGAWEALVYRYAPDTGWQQPFTLPVTAGLWPVGADFGPDGRFYLLERGIYVFGFYSRVRSMVMQEDGPADVRTELQTRVGQYGNLEGLSVWQDAQGGIRLTMVADNNFLWLQRSQFVEYVLPRGLATRAQQD